MSIQDYPNRVQYTAGAGATKFSIPFEFAEDADIKVYYTLAGATPDPAGNLLTLNTDYTVVGAGFNRASGTISQITLTPEFKPTGAAAGDIVTILNETRLQRTTDFEVRGDFTASDLNSQFDRIVSMIQQLNMKMKDLGLQYKDNAILLPDQKNNILPDLPANTGSGTPVWTTNSAGELIAGNLVGSDGYSTLRSELINNEDGTDGAGIVGYYNTTTSSPTTVRDSLNSLNATVSGNLWDTGDIKATMSIVAGDGWVLMNNETIGSASSGATGRANADTQPLFELLWTLSDASVLIYNSTGDLDTRGASATADFNANKRLQLPQVVGRSICGSGQQTYVQTFVADSGTDQLTVGTTQKYYEGMPVTVSTTGTLPSPLIAGTTYYVGIISGTEVKLAESTENLVAGTFIPLTTDGTGVNSITFTSSYLGLGEWLGEETHLLTIAEMPKHNHDPYIMGHNESGGIYFRHVQDSEKTVNLNKNTGGSAPHNNMQPSIGVNFMIRL